MRTCAEVHACHRVLKVTRARRVEFAVLANEPGRHRSIGENVALALEALSLNPPRCFHPRTDGGRRFGGIF